MCLTRITLKTFREIKETYLCGACFFQMVKMDEHVFFLANTGSHISNYTHLVNVQIN